jgi:hypothetical protein
VGSTKQKIIMAKSNRRVRKALFVVVVCVVGFSCFGGRVFFEVQMSHTHSSDENTEWACVCVWLEAWGWGMERESRARRM